MVTKAELRSFIADAGVDQPPASASKADLQTIVDALPDRPASRSRPVGNNAATARRTRRRRGN